MARRVIGGMVCPGDHLHVIIPRHFQLPFPGSVARRHGIYVGDDRVIQMDSLRWSGLRIEPVTFDDFARYGAVVRVRHGIFSPARLWTGAPLKPDQVVANAQRLEGTASSYAAYAVSMGSVQAANWCVTGFRRRRLRAMWFLIAAVGLLAAYASSWHPGLWPSLVYGVGVFTLLIHERCNRGAFIPPR